MIVGDVWILREERFENIEFNEKLNINGRVRNFYDTLSDTLSSRGDH